MSLDGMSLGQIRDNMMARFRGEPELAMKTVPTGPAGGVEKSAVKRNVDMGKLVDRAEPRKGKVRASERY